MYKRIPRYFHRKTQIYTHLKLTARHLPIPLEHHITVRVRIHREGVQRIELARAVEHVLVDFTVVTAQAAVELPVRDVPRVYQRDGVRSDFLEEARDGSAAGELDLADLLGTVSASLRLSTIFLHESRKRER